MYAKREIDCKPITAAGYSIGKPVVNTRQFKVDIPRQFNAGETDINTVTLLNPPVSDTVTGWVNENFDMVTRFVGMDRVVDYDRFVSQVMERFIGARGSKTATRNCLENRFKEFEMENMADLVSFYEENFMRYPSIIGVSGDRELLLSDKLEEIKEFEASKKKRATIKEKVINPVSDAGRIVFLVRDPRTIQTQAQITGSISSSQPKLIDTTESSVLKRESVRGRDDNTASHANVNFFFNGTMSLMGVTDIDVVSRVFDVVYDFIRDANVGMRIRYPANMGPLIPVSMNCVFKVDVGDMKLDLNGMADVIGTHFPDKYRVCRDQAVSGDIRFVRRGITEQEILEDAPEYNNIRRALNIRRHGTDTEMSFRPHASGKIIFIGGIYDIDAIICRVVVKTFLNDMKLHMDTLTRVHHHIDHLQNVREDMIPAIQEWVRG